jgi:hypothetical protein
MLILKIDFVELKVLLIDFVELKFGYADLKIGFVELKFLSKKNSVKKGNLSKRNFVVHPRNSLL